ncbi:transmembrane protein 136-like isoform X2 [Durio zibethinus]|uniref:Transmembrane protein 136-like isoform X2 n=1 Tax=Durio zibethinus TaxID=66656 RepID=A0A6P6B691_DURZI|nr:transmembrane protein 136-like isoform X2 [Durio zibethinus]
MGDDVVDLIVLGVISWTTVFVLIRKIFSKRSFEFCNRIVSTIHAILAVILASLTVEDWSCPVCPSASNSPPKQRQTLAVTIAYLIYDLICCLFGERVSLDNTVHHLVSIVGLGAGLVYQKCGSEQVAALFITEISSPFLHARELLKELGYRDTDLNLAADITFAVIFSTARMVGGPYLTFVTLTANNPILIKAMALGLQFVSAFWFYKIVKMVKYKLTNNRRKKVISSPLHRENWTKPVLLPSFTKMD